MELVFQLSAVKKHANPLPVIAEMKQDTLPCSGCGASMDQLRAPHVVAFEEGLSFFCSDQCLKKLKEHSARPSFEALRPARVSRSPVPLAPVNTNSIQSPGFLIETRRRWFIAAVTLSTLSLLMAAFAARSWIALLCTALSTTSVGIAFYVVREKHLTRNIFLGLGCIGTLLINAQAWMLVAEKSNASFVLAGAACCSLVVLFRVYTEIQVLRPIVAILRSMRKALPHIAKKPRQDDRNPTQVAFDLCNSEEVSVGEEILLLAGDSAPVDGTIRAGQAEAFPFPASKTLISVRPGQNLIAGTQVVRGALRMVATATRDQRLPLRSLSSPRTILKTPLSPATLHQAMYRWGLVAFAFAALFLLIIVDGIASKLGMLGLLCVVTPFVSLSRSGYIQLLLASFSAQNRGIFFNDLHALYRAGAVDTVAARSRGIVTEGRLQVVDVEWIDNSAMSKALALILSAESNFSQQPIAQALVRYASDHCKEPTALAHPTLSPGEGITGNTQEGEAFVIGNRQMLLNQGVSIAVAEETLKKAETLGRTTVLVAIGGKMVAVFAMQDEPSPHARVAVQRLSDLGIEVMLLSGDQKRTVEVMAAHLGIDYIKAELSPPERAHEIKKLREGGSVVAVVGDPSLDEILLREANIPIPLSSAGKGVSFNDSMALVGSDLRDAADGLWIAQACHRGIRKKIFAALTVGSCLMANTMFGQLPIMIGALAAFALDFYALLAPRRLQRRIDLRVPCRSW
ncbi:MAG: cation-translocating P-type ATPase [Myxococcales bacterium]|nr:MAG: cation-translocating P-type ATPase [Myxococcales bacterium]